MEALRCENLTKFYGKARGIVDLSFSVDEGEFFGFIGPNGAGKSTTIRTLLGLIKPTSGRADVFGQDIVRDKIEILRHVGYLPSEAIFYNGMRVKDLLKFSADLRRQDCAEEADALCEQLQLDVSRRVDELSFGNRKKVAIVCALQHKPRLLILDEPTSGLDPLMQQAFFSILQARNQSGTTVFLSSHVLSEIQHHCTRAAIIREGRLIVCDRVESLGRTRAKRVTVHGSFDPSPLPGVRDIRREEGRVSFLYGGDVNELIQALSQIRVRDLTLAEPDLEEVFLHYYTEGGETV